MACCAEHCGRGDVGMWAVAWCAVSVGVGLGVVRKDDGMSGAKTCVSDVFLIWFVSRSLLI